jgi:hypothetical protein
MVEGNRRMTENRKPTRKEMNKKLRQKGAETIEK